MRNFRYRFGYITDPGNRRSSNQDSLLIRTGTCLGKECLLAAVADGMGGMQRGDWASCTAVSLLDRWWTERLPGFVGETLAWDALCDSLVVTLEEINWTICTDSQDKDGRAGTTMSLMFFHGNRYLLLHVGDSRIYRVGRGGAVQLTRDQTWCQQELDAGRMTPAEAAVHPMRHALISTLGVEPQFRLQREEGTVVSSNAFLLCSDGFYQEFDVRAWKKVDDPQPLLEQARDAVKQGPAGDNLTAVLIAVTATWR